MHVFGPGPIEGTVRNQKAMKNGGEKRHVPYKTQHLKKYS
jgi:hypothetical protein